MASPIKKKQHFIDFMFKKFKRCTKRTFL